MSHAYGAGSALLISEDHDTWFQQHWYPTSRGEVPHHSSMPSPRCIHEAIDGLGKLQDLALPYTHLLRQFRNRLREHWLVVFLRHVALKEGGLRVALVDSELLARCFQKE